MGEDAAATTFCTALHTYEINSKEIIGQHATRKQIEEKPFDTLEFSQPFVQV